MIIYISCRQKKEEENTRFNGIWVQRSKVSGMTSFTKTYLNPQHYYCWFRTSGLSALLTFFHVWLLAFWALTFDTASCSGYHTISFAISSKPVTLVKLNWKKNRRERVSSIWGQSFCLPRKSENSMHTYVHISAGCRQKHANSFCKNISFWPSHSP